MDAKWREAVVETLSLMLTRPRLPYELIGPQDRVVLIAIRDELKKPEPSSADLELAKQISTARDQIADELKALKAKHALLEAERDRWKTAYGEEYNKPKVTKRQVVDALFTDDGVMPSKEEDLKVVMARIDAIFDKKEGT